MRSGELGLEAPCGDRPDLPLRAQRRVAQLEERRRPKANHDENPNEHGAGGRTDAGVLGGGARLAGHRAGSAFPDSGTEATPARPVDDLSPPAPALWEPLRPPPDHAPASPPPPGVDRVATGPQHHLAAHLLAGDPDPEALPLPLLSRSSLILRLEVC